MEDPGLGLLNETVEVFCTQNCELHYLRNAYRKRKKNINTSLSDIACLRRSIYRSSSSHNPHVWNSGTNEVWNTIHKSIRKRVLSDSSTDVDTFRKSTTKVRRRSALGPTEMLKIWDLDLLDLPPEELVG